MDNKDKKDISTPVNQIKKGDEFGEYQKAENQLLSINSEQKNNLQNAMIEDKLNTENNNNLATAATMMANGVGSDNSEQVPVQQVIPQRDVQLNPQTQAILSKYGVGKPRIIAKSERKIETTPTKVTINNNTTTNTTNNVSLSQPNIPIPQPVIPIKVKEIGRNNNGPGAIKSWLSNIFARQNEQAAIREKEYRRKEWSLTRSANKMMRRMEEVGRSFIDNLDPRKISTSFFDQAKTLMFLLGFQKLASNWKTILEISAKIEGKVNEFVDFFKKDGKNSKTIGFWEGFKKRVAEFLGGKENESIGSALKNLLKDVMNYFKLQLEHSMEIRAEAMKQIKFPSLDFKDILGTIKNIGEYIGNLLTSMISPKTGIKNSIKSQISDITKSNMINYSGKQKMDQEYEAMNSSAADATIVEGGKKEKVKDTSLGEASMFYGKKWHDHLNYDDLKDNGDLSNNLISSLRQGRAISSMTNSIEDNTVHSTSVLKGLENLKKSATRNKFTLVEKESLEGLKDLGVDTSKLNLKEKNYKFVKVEKTEEDFIKAKQDATHEALKSGISQAFLKQIGLGDFGGDVLGKVTLGDWFGGKKLAEIVNSPAFHSLTAGAKAAIRKLFSTKNKLKLVPEEDPRPAVEISVLDDLNNNEGIRKSKFSFVQLTPENIEEIRKQIAAKVGKDNFSFDTLDKESTLAFSELLKKVKENNIEKRKEEINKEVKENPTGSTSLVKEINELDKKKSSLTQDIDFEKTYEAIDNLSNLEKQQKSESDEFYNNSRIETVVSNSKELGNKAIDAAKEAAEGVSDWVGRKFKRDNTSEPIPKGEISRRSNLAVERLISEFDLTPQQASGLVGNWMAESYLDTTAENRKGGGNGALGLAQWREPRQTNFVKFYNSKHPDKQIHNSDDILKLPFEDQLDFAIHELKTTHSNAITEIKNTSNPADAAKAGFGYYEFSVGPEKAFKHMLDKGNSYDLVVSTFNKRQRLANGIYKDYLDNKSRKTDEIKVKDVDEDLTSKDLETIAGNQYYSSSNPIDNDIPRIDEFTSSTNNLSFAEKLDPVSYKPIKYSEANNLVADNKTNINILDEVKNVSTNIVNQTNTISILSNNINKLAYIAANSGNIMVTNNSNGGSRMSQGGYTTAPNVLGNNNFQSNIT